ncbi:phosphotransferase [Lentzea tibetensis]|uniref:Phosphotransferase n=1 Tax=Lentzea tibetensis TaxID=2591470 RepID=A0A563EJG5_9PSEU|nr:phosphotransferase [Lentzea tibetensis]TWP47008.1 phosphotransferase [Lentzea tibetensis]
MTDAWKLIELLRAAGVPGPVEVHEIGGGTFNSTYRVAAGDRRWVLKVAPKAGGLSYEHDLLSTEAAFYRAAAGVLPVPEVVHLDTAKEIVPSDWLLMTECPGVNWFEHAEQLAPHRGALRSQLGATVARLHRVTGTAFGYPQGERAPDWPTAFTSMMTAVLDDAAFYGVDLPVSADRVRGVLTAARETLAEVREPVLVHFDLWPGNVLVDGDRITGIVDGERSFWGDPLADMPSLGLFGLIEDDADFLAGYHLDLTSSARIRLDLYRAYLYLIMTVEATPRGTTGGPLNQLVHAHLRDAVERLER